MGCALYKIRKLSDDFGDGLTTWTEAFIDGKWVKHGKYVCRIYRNDGEDNLYFDMTEVVYKKGVVVNKSTRAKQCTCRVAKDPIFDMHHYLSRDDAYRVARGSIFQIPRYLNRDGVYRR